MKLCLLTSILFARVFSLSVSAIEPEATRLQQEELRYPDVTAAMNEIRAAKIKETRACHQIS